MKENEIFAEVNKSLPEHVVLKLAVDNENLGLCDSRDYFTDKLNFDF